MTETRNLILGCRIDNIYTNSLGNIYLFRLLCKNGELFLLVEPGKRIHLTKYTRQRELNKEILKLRGLLREAFIKELEIINKERIISIKLSNEHIIYVEIIPRGVLVVTNNENKIIFTSEQKEMKDRSIKVGLIYKLPPKPELTEGEIEKLIKTGNLSKLLGVPMEVVNYLKISVKSKEELEIARRVIEGFENKLKNGEISPCITSYTVVPFKIDENCMKADSFNDALDKYFLNLEKLETEEKLKEELESEKAKLISTIEQIKKSIEEYKSKALELRRIAEVILNNSLEIENMLRSNKIKLRSNKIIITINGIEISLDPKVSIGKNASYYFNLAKEYEEKIKSAESTLSQLYEKLNQINNKIYEKKEEIKVSMRRREWYERYRWSITSNGLLVLAGKDMHQNESLVRKYLEDNDIFLHADIQGAAAVIIKVGDKEKLTQDDIFDAALIAACYSRAWKTGLGSIEVFWVNGSQVSKSPPSGEYLPKGSFMIYGKKNYLKVNLELYLGFEKIEDSFRVLVGSENVVKSRSYKIYFKLVPGDEDQNKIADKIIKIFERESGHKGLKVIKDEIIRVLPGKSIISKVIKIP
jgi:predicted ribosome quality control (RQC) complex YloA/Tae2 family protein